LVADFGRRTRTPRLMSPVKHGIGLRKEALWNAHGFVSPTGHVSSALLTRVDLLLQANATLRFRSRGRWRLKSGDL
jgi:hypothetical protein